VGYVSVRTPLTKDEKRSATRHLKWTDTLGVHVSSQSIKSIGSPLLISILLVTAILANLFLGSLSTYLDLAELSPLTHAFVAFMSIMCVGLLFESYRDNRPNKSTMSAVNLVKALVLLDLCQFKISSLGWRLGKKKGLMHKTQTLWTH